MILRLLSCSIGVVLCYFSYAGSMSVIPDTAGDSALAEAYFNKADTFLLFNRHDSSVFYFERAFDVFAKTRTPEVGRSKRWTTPK